MNSRFNTRRKTRDSRNLAPTAGITQCKHLQHSSKFSQAKEKTAYKLNGFKLSGPTLPVLKSSRREEGVNSSSAMLWTEAQPEHMEHFRFLGGLSAQRQEIVMEHWVLRFFLSFDISTLCWILFRWKAGQGKSLSFLYCMHCRIIEQYSIPCLAWTLF